MCICTTIQHINVADICNKLSVLPTIQPSKVAFSNIGHRENPEDGFDDDIMNLEITIQGVLIGSYIINTEAKEQNVQNLRYGDDLCFRDVRKERKLYFDCGWRILDNICEREATPQRRGRQRLIITLLGPIQRIERNQDVYGMYTHNTVLATRYNKKETQQGRCVYSLKR